MRKLFYENFPLNQEEQTELLRTSIIVLDTNIILNLYRYSEATADELKQTLDFYKSRVWIPYQVAQEYFNNRLPVINEQHNYYQNTIKDITNIKISFRRTKGHPFLDKSLLNDFENVLERIENDLAQSMEAMNKLTYSDYILEEIGELFLNKVGERLSNEDLAQAYISGKERYKNNVPPGFKDKKPEPERYGDYIIWLEMIEKAKKEDKDIVFVCDDEKEDWWLKNKGKTISPLPELIREFKEKTGRTFTMYKMLNFIKKSSTLRNKQIDQPVIDEIKSVSELRSETDQYHKVEFNIYLSEENSDKINVIKQSLSEYGYESTVIMTDQNNYKFNLTVLFIDLARRIESRIRELATSLNVDLTSFTCTPRNS